MRIEDLRRLRLTFGNSTKQGQEIDELYTFILESYQYEERETERTTYARPPHSTIKICLMPTYWGLTEEALITSYAPELSLVTPTRGFYWQRLSPPLTEIRILSNKNYH